MKQQENLNVQKVNSLENENDLLAQTISKKDDLIKKLREEIERLKKFIENLKREMGDLKTTIHKKEDEIIMTLDKVSTSESDKNVSLIFSILNS